MNGKLTGGGSNGITQKQALLGACTLLLLMVGGLVTIVLQGGKDTDKTVQTLRLDVQDLKSWKDNWKPQVDAFLLTTQTLDKNVAILTGQLSGLVASSKDLLAAIRSQQEELEKLGSLQIGFRGTMDQFRGQLDRIESQSKRR